jgi:putative ABC transport system permease protein
VRLATTYLRSTWRRTGGLGAGIAAAAAAFAVLGMNAAAATVQIRGSVPPASPARAYDILVRPAGPAGQHAAGTELTRPGDLTKLSGGITLAQYYMIRRLAGVQVAAPMTMVGYVPLTVTVSAPVSAAATTSKSQLLAVTSAYRSDNGLSTVTERAIGSTYVSGGHQPPTVPVSISWTFALPLVAVDPTAEAGLQLLDKAVIRGSYLPTAAAAPGAPVPVIMASSIDDSDQEQLSLTRLPVSPARPQAGGRTGPKTGGLHPVTAGRTVGTATVTAAQAYRQLLSHLSESGTARVLGYWTTSPGTYALSADGDVVPHSVANHRATIWGSPQHGTAVGVAADTEDVGFSSLTPHVARTQGPGHVLRAGAALTAVGVFDPGALPTSPATPSPYRGEQLPGADPASRRLLGGQPLRPASDPAGYPNPAATLVMPLQDISAFTAAASYTDVDARAPIGSIRVRVANATGDDALSQERIRAVADEIVRATGLDVEVTLAATAVPRTVALPAGRLGRPPLLLSEVWYRSDTATIVVTAVDPTRIALAALILLAGAAFFGNAARAALRARRRDLATLTALGWPRRQLRRQLLQEFTVVALASGLLAVVAAAATGAAFGHRPVSGWAALGLPAAVVMTIGAAWLPVRTATAEAERHGAAAAARRTAARPGRQPWLAPAGSLRREPRRTAVGALVIAVACAPLGAELALRWAFGGALVGSVAGRPVSWLTGPGDVSAVLALLVMATITVADVDWLAAADRAVQVRTLRALGWPASGHARLVAAEAALLGIVGGVTAGVVDVVGCLAVAHQVPGRVLTAAAVAAVAGVLLSLVAAGLSAVIGRTTSVIRLRHETRPDGR